MENKAKGTNEMSDTVLEIVRIIVSLIGTIVRIIDIVVKPHTTKVACFQ